MSKLYERLVRQLHLGKMLWPLQRRGLYCFNFHRIGDWRKSDFDPCVFSCSAADLRSYLRFFRENFSVASLDDVAGLVAEDRPLRERLALITFDDGYRDNFDEAFPVLREAAVPATFFIATGLIEAGEISWWDEVAWHTRKLAGKTIRLSGWRNEVTIRGEDARHDVRQVLGGVKASGISVYDQVEEIRHLTGLTVPDARQSRLFMNWDELKTMTDAGMSVGAHSHSHDIFANMSDERLRYELRTSKQLLQDKLGASIRSLSYPVGSTSSFSSGMFGAIQDCGYDLAFSFNPVVNVHVSAHRYELGRASVDAAFNEVRMLERCVSLKKL